MLVNLDRFVFSSSTAVYTIVTLNVFTRHITSARMAARAAAAGGGFDMAALTPKVPFSTHELDLGPFLLVVIRSVSRGRSRSRSHSTTCHEQRRRPEGVAYRSVEVGDNEFGGGPRAATMVHDSATAATAAGDKTKRSKSERAKEEFVVVERKTKQRGRSPRGRRRNSLS